MSDDDTPRDRLYAARRECDLGIARAESCIEEDLLRTFEAGYRNRALWWLTCRDAVDRALAALPEEATHEA